jgi:septum formation protein
VKLILASASPRRRELLTLAGYTFEVVPANIDEARRDGETPVGYVERLAKEKARAVYLRFPDATVLAADTTVALDGGTLNKPRDREDARRMLLALSGRAHDVHTGIAVVGEGQERAHVETTRVVFGEIAADELEAYLATEEPMDKAGAYGIQGFAARWIPRIEGDYSNVVGLPIVATVRLLRG